MNAGVPRSDSRGAEGVGLVAAPALRRIAIAAFIVLVPVGLHALWDSIEVRRLVREIETIRAKGEPVTEQEAGRGYQSLSDEQKRASRYYLAAAGLAVDTFAKHRSATTALQELVSGASVTRPAKEALTERLRHAVEDSRDGLALFDTATALDFKGFPGGTYNSRTYELQTLSQLSSARTAYLSLSGDGDGAIRSALAALKLRRVLLADSSWFWLGLGSHDVPLVLSLSQPSAGALRQIQDALELEENPDLLQQATLAQRAEFLDQIWRQRYGPDVTAPRHYALPMRSVTETITRPWFTHQLVDLLRAWSELIDAERLPWPDRAQAVAAVRNKFQPTGTPQSSSTFLSAGLMASAFYVPAPAVVAGPLVNDRASRTAVALERFRRDHAGALPETLQVLVPDYLAAVPVDPFSGRPLIYRHDADAYTVYSVGPDRKDDGGDLTSEFRRAVRRGWGQKRLAGRDEGVRIPLRQ